MELLLILGLGFLIGRSSKSTTTAPPTGTPPTTEPDPVVDPPLRSTSRWRASFAPTLIGSISRTPDGWSAVLRTYRETTEAFAQAVLTLAARAQEGTTSTTSDIRVATTDGAIIGTVQRNAMPDGRYTWRVMQHGDVVFSGVQPARNFGITELAAALQIVVDEADAEA